MERFTKFFSSLGGVLASLAAVVGGVVALYVAFGGGGDQSGPPPETPVVVGTTSDAAVEDWRTQVEDVCRDSERRVNQLGPNPVDQAALVVRMQQVLPIFDALANGIRALDEPNEVQNDVERLLANMDRQSELAHTLVNSFQTGDLQRAEGARLALQGLGTDANRVLADLGLRGCVGFS